MKSLGNIREMTREEKTKFIKLIADRLNGKDIGDKLPLEPTAKEKEEALSRLASGEFYCFEPLDYAYCVYERG
jgi:hypothetical protein